MKNRPFRERFVFAATGIRDALRSEKSFRFQALCACAVVVVLLVLRPPLVWCAILLMNVAAVLAAELFNTALEHVIDRMHPEKHPLIAAAKDAAAGAVLMLSFVSLVVFVLFLAATTARADEPFKPYLDCLKATSACSRGVARPIPGGAADMAVVFANRQGKDGFYAYAAEDAYFHEFPPAPPPAPKHAPPPPPSIWNLYGFVTKMLYKEPPKPNLYFYFRLEAGIHEPLFLSFKRDEATLAPELTLVSRKEMPGANYVKAEGGECHADAESRAPLVSDVLARVRMLASTYLSAPMPEAGDVANEYNVAGHEERHYFRKDDCLRPIDSCLGSEELKSAALAEKEKLK